jgi:hypothetical protein
MKLGVIFAVGLLGACAIACGSTSEEATGQSEGAQITDVLTMTKRGDGNFDVVCQNGAREVATPQQILANQVCGAGTPPPAAPILGRVFGRTDDCSGNPVVTVRADTDCFGLSGTADSWSIWSNGECKNISDTNVRSACLSLNKKGRAVFGRTDDCSGAPVMVMNDTTDCFSLSSSADSWSVWDEGQCKNISDTTQRNACLALQPGGRAIFGRSDDCSGAPIAKINTGFDCFTLPDNGDAWSVWADGQCKNISDTSPRAACLALEPQ